MSANRVQRWDVYDIADELADVQGMVSRIVTGQSSPGETLRDLYTKLADLEQRLWTASEISGRVSPYPEYLTVEV